MSASSRRFAGAVLALVSATLYGITPIFVNLAYDEGADPSGLMTARYSIASVILLGVRLARIGTGAWPPRAVQVRLFLLGAIGLWLNGVCVFNAIDRMDSGLVMVLFYFYPIVVVLLGWLLYQHRPDRVIWPCLALTIGGVTLSASDVSGGEFVGVALIVLGAIVYAVYSVVGARTMASTDVITGLWFVLTGCACSFGAVWLIDPPGLPSTMPGTAIAWLSALEIAVIGTIVAMGAFFAGVVRVGASSSAVIQTFEVLVTVTMGIIVLNESLTGRQVLGAAMILSGVIWLTIAEARRATSARESPSLEGHLAL